jgi:RHS repeat-associated protein
LYHANGPSNGYDGFNQLTHFRRGALSDSNSDGIPDTVTTASRYQTWTHDVMGNWDLLDDNGTTDDRGHNKQNQITSGGGSPGYDNSGNTTQFTDGGTTRKFIYDAWNRLVTITNSAGTTTLAAYTYDALGRRVTETRGEDTAELYYSDAWQVLEERKGTADTTQYVWSPLYVDGLVLRDHTTATGQYNFGGGSSLSTRYYVQQDANWNVTALVDASDNSSKFGEVVERYVYDPFGQVSYLDGSWGARTASSYEWVYQHQGGRLDTAINLYHFRNRDFSPTLGRWLQNDPLSYAAGDTNLYRNVGNGPTSYVDPSGLAKCIAAWCLATEFGLSDKGGTQKVQVLLIDGSKGYAILTPDGMGGWTGQIPKNIDIAGGLISPEQRRRSRAEANRMQRWKNIQDAAVGFGDGASGGGSRAFRRWMGYDDVVNGNSAYYQGGMWSGVVVGAVTAPGTVCGRGATGLGIRFINGAQAVGNGAAVAEGINEGNALKAGLGMLGAAGNLGQLQKICFAAGTPLLTPTGDKLIEQFRVGDWILTAPEDNPEAPPEASQVEEVFTGEQAILALRVSGKVIRTTELHPFWVRGRGWTATKELIAGDHLRSHDDRWMVVESVTTSGEVVAVYNLRIADYHTYFVGSRAWGWSAWAHNSCVYQSIQNDTVRYAGIADTGAGSTLSQRITAASTRTPSATTSVISGTVGTTPLQAQQIEQALINYYGREGIEAGGTLVNQLAGKNVSAANTDAGYSLLSAMKYWGSQFLMHSSGSGI